MLLYKKLLLVLLLMASYGCVKKSPPPSPPSPPSSDEELSARPHDMPQDVYDAIKDYVDDDGNKVDNALKNKIIDSITKAIKLGPVANRDDDITKACTAASLASLGPKIIALLPSVGPPPPTLIAKPAGMLQAVYNAIRDHGGPANNIAAKNAAITAIDNAITAGGPGRDAAIRTAVNPLDSTGALATNIIALAGPVGPPPLTLTAKPAGMLQTVYDAISNHGGAGNHIPAKNAAITAIDNAITAGGLGRNAAITAACVGALAGLDLTIIPLLLPVGGGVLPAHVTTYLNNFVLAQKNAMKLEPYDPKLSKIDIFSDAYHEHYFGDYGPRKAGLYTNISTIDLLVDEYITRQLLIALGYLIPPMMEIGEPKVNIKLYYDEYNPIIDAKIEATKLPKIDIANLDKTKGGLKINAASPDAQITLTPYLKKVLCWILGLGEPTKLDGNSRYYLTKDGIITSSFGFDFMSGINPFGNDSAMMNTPPNNKVENYLADIYDNAKKPGVWAAGTHNAAVKNKLVTEEMMLLLVYQLEQLIHKYDGINSILLDILQRGDKLANYLATKHGTTLAAYSKNIPLFVTNIEKNINDLLTELDGYLHNKTTLKVMNDFKLRQAKREKLIADVYAKNPDYANGLLYTLVGPNYLNNPSDDAELSALTEATVITFRNDIITNTLANYPAIVSSKNIVKNIYPLYPTNKKFYIIYDDSKTGGKLTADHVSKELVAKGWNLEGSFSLNSATLGNDIKAPIGNDASLIVVETTNPLRENPLLYDVIHKEYVAQKKEHLPRYMITVMKKLFAGAYLYNDITNAKYFQELYTTTTTGRKVGMIPVANFVHVPPKRLPGGVLAKPGKTHRKYDYGYSVKYYLGVNDVDPKGPGAVINIVAGQDVNITSLLDFMDNNSK